MFRLWGARKKSVVKGGDPNRLDCVPSREAAGEERAPSLAHGFGQHLAEDAGTLAAMEAEGCLYLVEPGGGAWLRPRPGAFDGVRSLDGAWLEHVLGAVDGLTVAYQHGVDLVVGAVDRGDATAAVLIRPVSVAEIERTAREGLLMPPKSTFFTPKLRTGPVLRPLD